MRSESSPPDPAVDIQETWLKLLVRELRQVYDLVDVHPANSGSSISNEPEGMLRIVVRWYDNSPLARILLAPDHLIVELGPRRSEGWKKVVRIRYQDPRSVEQIFRLLEQALP
jgi:hypothetical protein